MILAIDLGIKNFGFCRIQLDKNLPFNKPPTVKEWKKLDLANLRTESFEATKLDLVKFDPVNYSRLASELIENVLYNPKMPRPDIVLIERQRGRTTSSRNIQEWILKVNMFESMLFGMLYSKISSETPNLLDNLISVNPLRMASYYKEDQRRTKSESKKGNPKTERIELVEKWLRYTINPDRQTEPRLYLDPKEFPFTNTSSLQAIRSKSKWVNELILGPDSKMGSGTVKGDDLADSLLHALSWVEWERNRMILKMELMMDVKEGLRVSDAFFKEHFESLK